jgi:peroxiredoxin
MTRSYDALPEDLPRPEDDGAADHLVGRRLPRLVLRSTAGIDVDFSGLGRPLSVLFLYPMTGRPGVPLPPGWDDIPGARGCTPQNAGFRDHHVQLTALGADVHGLSSQSPPYQREVSERLGLPFPLLSDTSLALADALSLPTFVVDGTRLFRRLTMVVVDGVVVRVFYPVFPPDRSAAEVASWLAERAGAG